MDDRLDKEPSVIINPLFGLVVFIPVMGYNFPHRAAGAAVLESQVSRGWLPLGDDCGARAYTGRG